MAMDHVSLLQNRVRTDDLLMGYFAMPSWTPAMGAQLVCGIQPVPNCTDIPKSGCQLSDPQSAATLRQLDWAGKVLARWFAEQQDDDETAEPPQKIAPMDFVIWCSESYENVGAPFRPEWLDYIFSFFSAPSKSSPPVAKTAHMLKRALKLEEFASVVSDRVNYVDVGNSTTHKNFRERILALSDKGRIRSVIATEIAMAMDKANNPYSVGEIWTLLCQRAKSNESNLLKPMDPDGFKVPRSEDAWVPYKRSALEKTLARLKKLLSDKNPN